MNSSVSPSSEPCEIVPTCPICFCGPMNRAWHQKAGLHICVCVECGTTLTVTAEAWERLKPEGV